MSGFPRRSHVHVSMSAFAVFLVILLPSQLASAELLDYYLAFITSQEAIQSCSLGGNFGAALLLDQEHRTTYRNNDTSFNVSLNITEPTKGLKAIVDFKCYPSKAIKKSDCLPIERLIEQNKDTSKLSKLTVVLPPPREEEQTNCSGYFPCYKAGTYNVSADLTTVFPNLPQQWADLAKDLHGMRTIILSTDYNSWLAAGAPILECVGYMPRQTDTTLPFPVTSSPPRQKGPVAANPEGVAIAGIVVASLLFVVVIAAFLHWRIRKQRKRQQAERPAEWRAVERRHHRTEPVSGPPPVAPPRQPRRGVSAHVGHSRKPRPERASSEPPRRLPTEPSTSAHPPHQARAANISRIHMTIERHEPPRSLPIEGRRRSEGVPTVARRTHATGASEVTRHTISIRPERPRAVHFDPAPVTVVEFEVPTPSELSFSTVYREQQPPSYSDAVRDLSPEAAGSDRT